MMTAKEAMEMAIRLATNGSLEHSRLWLDIARELRMGSAREVTPRIHFEAPSPEAIMRPGEAIEGDGTRCESCGYYLKYVDGQWLHTRTGQHVCPVNRPGPDDTIVHTIARPEQ